MSNAAVANIVNTSDAWIRSMTGIEQRYIAGEGESTTDMALVAAQRALQNANVHPSDLDLIIVATITPDLVFPSTAAISSRPRHLTAARSCFANMRLATEILSPRSVI